MALAHGDAAAVDIAVVAATIDDGDDSDADKVAGADPGAPQPLNCYRYSKSAVYIPGAHRWSGHGVADVAALDLNIATKWKNHENEWWIGK